MRTFRVKALCRGIQHTFEVNTAHAAATQFLGHHLPNLTLQGVPRSENPWTDAEGHLFSIWSVSASHMDPNEPGERLWIFEQIGGF